MNRPQFAIKGKPGLAGFSERLRCVREMRQLSQSDLAKKLRVLPAHISHWECEQRTPHVKHLRALCLTLNVSADYLLDSNQ